MDILKRLHHRPPYLLVDTVLESSAKAMKTLFTPSGEEFFLKGHFPGTPVVPGSMMQEMTTQSAGLLITEYHSPVPDYDSERTRGWALGVLRAVHLAKYKSFARPGEALTIKVELVDQLENSFRFKGRIEKEGACIMFNEFTLVNIDESKLKG
jgi:3-hydroxyacyl-[acyl-carrier-protein] dehydratase